MKRKRSRGLWYRLYVSVLDDPKIEALSDAVFRAWVKLNAVATIYGGIIPSDMAILTVKLRKPLGKVREYLQVLISAGLLERCGDDFTPHDWEEWQFDSDVSTNRVRAFRQRSKPVDETVMKRSIADDETNLERPHSTENIEQRTEKKVVERARRATPKTELPPDFPTPELVTKAQGFWNEKGRPDLSHSARDEAEHFRDHHLQLGNRFADWSAAWRTWQRRALKHPAKDRMNGHGRRESPLEQSERIARDLIREDAGNEGANSGADRVPRIAVRTPSDERCGAPDMARNLLRRPEGEDR